MPGGHYYMEEEEEPQQSGMYRRVLQVPTAQQTRSPNGLLLDLISRLIDHQMH